MNQLEESSKKNKSDPTQSYNNYRTFLTNPTDIVHKTSALTLSKAIKNREISCVEVMQAYLAHIKRNNPTFNAIVALEPEQSLLEQAQLRDQELDQGIYQGWMHGFPHAIKDLALTKSIASTSGSLLYKDYVPCEDSYFVERIKKAGAIIIGKTNAPEFGLGSHTYNPVYGTTANAYNPDLSAGGSSGGAAVALATHMVPVADGSDMMGSLRNPAAFNGVFGFRPSMGRVASGYCSDIFYQQLGYEGPMANNVEDLARLLATMSGYDARAPLSIPQDPNQFCNNLSTDLKGKRIAWLGNFDGYLPMENGILELCEKSLHLFTDLGCTVEPIKVDFDMDYLWQVWLTLRQWIVGSALHDTYQDPKKRELMSPQACWEIENSLSLNGLDIFRASEGRSSWYLKVNELFRQYDILALPSAQVFAFDKTKKWPEEIAGTTMDTYHKWMQIVTPGSLSGCPVANVPVGFNSKGNPMGMQLWAPHLQDFKLLQTAFAYQSAMPKTHQTPSSQIIY